MYNFSFFCHESISFLCLTAIHDRTKENEIKGKFSSLFSLGKMQLILNSFFSEKLFVYGDHVDSKGLRMKDSLETSSSFFSQPFEMEKAPP